MSQIIHPCFPFPRVISGTRITGYDFDHPSACNECNRVCESTAAANTSVCPHGINYLKIGPNEITYGFILTGTPSSSAHNKAIRKYSSNRTTKSKLERAVSIYSEYCQSIKQDIELSKANIMDSYLEEHMYKKDLLELFRPEIERNLSFLHDYKQFIARVKQNINVVLENRYGFEDINQLLDKALPSEKAIYWASMLMTEKLQTAFLLLHPDKLQHPTPTVFSLHGLVLKYIRIYQSSYDEKKIELTVQGSSNGHIRADSAAVGVIPQTLLDNALKYSARGATVRVRFDERFDSITLKVRSYSPKIEEYEKDKIFNLFYRGINAKKAQEEGSGFGLHLAQFVAKSLNTMICVQQADTPTPNGYETEFSVQFQRTT